LKIERLGREGDEYGQRIRQEDGSGDDTQSVDVREVALFFHLFILHSTAMVE
jgi:hypothetical protein